MKGEHRKEHVDHGIRAGSGLETPPPSEGLVRFKGRIDELEERVRELEDVAAELLYEIEDRYDGAPDGGWLGIGSLIAKARAVLAKGKEGA